METKKDKFKSILCLEEHSKWGRNVIKRGKTYSHTLLYSHLFRKDKLVYISYLYLLFESVLNLVFYFLKKHNIFYIQLLYKTGNFVNNVMCCWNLFWYSLQTVHTLYVLNDQKRNQINISISIIYIRKKKYFNNIREM